MERGEGVKHARVRDKPLASTMRWLAQAVTLLPEGVGDNELPEVAAGHPLGAAAL